MVGSDCLRRGAANKRTRVGERCGMSGTWWVAYLGGNRHAARGASSSSQCSGCDMRSGAVLGVLADGESMTGELRMTSPEEPA